jgi:hypothetical protein
VKAVSRVLLASVVALGGCSLIRDDPAPAAATPSAVSPFGGTDRAWISITTAMDEDLLPLLALVPDHSGSSDVQALALQVQAFTNAELTELHSLRDAAGMPRVNQHKNMQMPGMVTADQVTKTAKLTGKAFDTTVTTAIKAHLEQSEQLATSEDKSGVEPQTRALALQVLRTRQTVLESMKKAA